MKDLAISSYGDTAWAEFYWDFAAKLRKDGSPLATHGRETQVYRKMNGAWRPCSRSLLRHAGHRGPSGVLAMPQSDSA